LSQGVLSHPPLFLLQGTISLQLLTMRQLSVQQGKLEQQRSLNKVKIIV